MKLNRIGCLLFAALSTLAGCGAGYHNPMMTGAPASSPASSPTSMPTSTPQMPMHHKK